jgi:hypothetical protein
MRSSLKACVWLGPADCHRSQDSVLWAESQRNALLRTRTRFDAGRASRPSVGSVNEFTSRARGLVRGGVTPFNVLPIPNCVNGDSAGGHGHGAGTPLDLADWWTRYICPVGGVVLDPFLGSGTMGIAAVENGCGFVGIERDPGYFAIAEKRIAAAEPRHPLFSS